MEIQKTIVRSEKVTIRFSPWEYQYMKTFCENHFVTVADFVRQCIKQAVPLMIETDRKARE
jgi:hypothetical protein